MKQFYNLCVIMYLLEGDTMLTKIKINYNEQLIDAILLAKFSIRRKFYEKKKFFGIKREKLIGNFDFNNCYMVYIPWKYRSKEVTLIGENLIKNNFQGFIDKNKIISIENFETIYENENSIIKTYISNFEGYKFLYDKELFKGQSLFNLDICLNILNNELPELLEEEFNDEMFVENMFITFQDKHGSAYLEFQYYKEDSLNTIYKKIKYDKIDSLYVNANKVDHFADIYFDFLNPCKTHNFDIYGVNYYTKEQAKTIYMLIKNANIEYSKNLLQWLEKSFTDYNGFYILGI